jgi:hypothetical protein
MNDFLPDLLYELRRYKDWADRAVAQLDERELFQRPAPHVNSVAIIVKHLAGNLASRWSDFLTTDGEKPSRDRDGEFVITEADSRESLLAAWERGWGLLFSTVEGLNPSGLPKTITIRGETHTALQALLRGVNHIAYHTGQVLYIVRLLRPDSDWLTMAPGQSSKEPGDYRTRA